MKEIIYSNPNSKCAKYAYDNSVQITIDYLNNSKCYIVSFSIINVDGIWRSTTIDFVKRFVVLKFVSRRSKKVLETLEKWLETHKDNLFREFTFMGGDNMWGVMEYIRDNMPEGIDFDTRVDYSGNHFKYQPKTYLNYHPITDAWIQLGNCHKDVAAIEAKFNELFEEYKSDYKKITELAIVTNHLLWFWHGLNDDVTAKFYDTLWKFVRSYCCENLEGDAAEYYFENTD